MAGTPHSGAAMAGARKRPRTAAAEGGDWARDSPRSGCGQKGRAAAPKAARVRQKSGRGRGAGGVGAGGHVCSCVRARVCGGGSGTSREAGAGRAGRPLRQKRRSKGGGDQKFGRRRRRGEGEGAGRGGEGGIEPGTPRAAVAGETAGPFRQKRRGSENTRAPPGRAGGVAGQAESVAQLRIHSRPDSTACASSRWLPWASGCAACAVDQPWLRHIHSRVSATINFFAEPDVGARPGTEQFCGCAHPCCDQ